MIGSNSKNSKAVTPANYLCPITLEVMKDPVTTPLGLTYDRQAILHWLDTCTKNDTEKTCPLSRVAMEEWELVDNQDLKREIMQWKKERGMKLSSSSSPSVQNNDRQQTYVSKASKVTVSPHLVIIRERILKRREQQIHAQLAAMRSTTSSRR